MSCRACGSGTGVGVQKHVPGNPGGTRTVSIEDPAMVSLRELTLAALVSYGGGHSEEPQVLWCLLRNWDEGKDMIQ